KIRLDDQSLETAIDHLAAIESPLARSLVWSAVWDATRDAEARPRDFVRLVLNNVGSESESTTIRQVVAQAVLVASSYVAPGGQADGPEIVATLAADDTATGRESAAHARAAIPTAEGKAAAWASVVDSAALPNATVRATTLGFRRAIDLAVLEPYVEQYFAVV